MEEIAELVSFLFEVSTGAAGAVTHNPFIGLIITIVSAVAHAVTLGLSWNVWVRFQRDGFSDNPLIPPSVPWMEGWLAFTIVRTIVAVMELVAGLVAFCGELYEYYNSSLTQIRYSLRWLEEGLNAMGIFFDLLLLLLGYFYYVVQSDCLDLNHSDKVVITTTFITASLIWKMVKFGIELCVHSGLCCCNKSWHDMVPSIVMNIVCVRFILVPVLAVSGIVLLALIVNLIDKTKSFDRSSIQVLRSEPAAVFFNITDLPLSGTENLTFTEALPLQAPGTDNDTVYCLATFRYDPDAYEFVFNIAYIDIDASSENDTCVCVPNHELCEPHYNNLYYGHSSNGDPYECFDRSADLVGVDKENSPTRDRDSVVHCTCEELPLLPARRTGGTG